MSSVDLNPNYEKLIKLFKSGAEVPSLPVTAFKLKQLLDDPNSTITDMQKVIELDPGLAGRLLKLARSPIYSRGTAVNNVEEAIQRIGLKNVRTAALTLEVIEALRGGYERYVNWNGFWYHSILTAQLCEKFESAYFPNNLGTGFIAGLIHDCGKLFMAKYFGDQVAFIHSLSGDFRDVPGTEFEILGFNHATASSMLAQTWGLQEDVSNSILYHHDPLRREKAADYVMSLILSVCDGLANLTGINVTPVEFSWDEFQEYPPWVKLQEIEAPRPIEFEIDEEANKAQETVNRIAGDEIVG